MFRLTVRRASPDAAGQLFVPVIRDGRAIDLVVDDATLTVVEEREGWALVDLVSDGLTLPEGQQMQSVEDMSGYRARLYAMIWSTMPTNRDNPRIDIPGPTTLRLVEPLD